MTKKQKQTNRKHLTLFAAVIIAAAIIAYYGEQTNIILSQSNLILLRNNTGYERKINLYNQQYPERTDRQQIKDKTLKEFEKEGLNPDVAECVIFGESGFDPNQYNINNNKTVDLGMMMWNSIHIKSGLITLSCAADPLCSVHKAIEKVKNDKGWSAWCAYRDNDCGKFGNYLIK